MDEYQELNQQFLEAGWNIIAISPESKENTLKTVEEQGLDYTVFSDPGANVGMQFNVVYEMQPALAEMFAGNELDVAAHNAMGKAVLPITATYLITQDGIIRWAWLDTDYKSRPEPAEVLEAAKAISAGDQPAS